MPKLGADLAAGKLVSWRKKPGDAVKRSDIIAEVEIEVEVFADGVVEKLLVEPGVESVGTPLATIREEGEPEQTVGSITPTAPIPPAAPSRVRAFPTARELAKSHGIDLATIHGIGPDGAITREDVERAGPVPKQVPKPSEDRQARMWQVLAAAMTRSKREVPHYYLSTTIDLHAVTAWLAERNATRPVAERLLPGVLFLKATALAIHEVPELNGFWTETGETPSRAIHLGAAISLRGGGLMPPAITLHKELSVDIPEKDYPRLATLNGCVDYFVVAIATRPA